MGAPPLVRPLATEDADAFAALVEDHPLFRPYGLTRERVARRLAEAEGRGQVVLTAVREGRPLGFVWLHESGTLGAGGYVRLLVVAHDRTGGGVGGRLLDAAEARVFARSRHLFLLVRTENERARAFYRRRGYRRVGTLPSYAAPGIDEHLLHKPRPEADA